MLTFHIVVVFVVLLGVIFALFKDVMQPALVMLTAVVVLLATGTIEAEQVLAGFSNKSIATIVLLILTAGALSRNFDIKSGFERIFPQSLSIHSFHRRMTVILAACSAFINNTPIVALALPNVYQWAKDKNSYPSKFLMSMSFATMMGGMLTVIGTSTNLVLIGLMEENGIEVFDYLEFSLVGLSVVVVGLIFINTVGFRLMPEHGDLIRNFRDHVREFLVEVHIAGNSDIVGKTIQEAGLRALSSGYLMQIDRKGKQISPISPQEVLEKGDVLFFSGQRELIFDILRTKKGLELNQQTKYFTDEKHFLFEVVVARNSILSGKTVKELRFREKFDSAIIAVHRNGELIQSKIGDLRLQPGDMLLLLSNKQMSYYDRYARDFYVVSLVGKNPSAKHQVHKVRAFTVLALIAVLAALAGFLSLFPAMLFVVFLLFLLGLYSIDDLKKDVSIGLVSILAFSITLGSAVIDSGAADFIAGGVLNLLQGSNPVFLISGILITTMVLTAFVSNVAAVTIMFPIAMAIDEMAMMQSSVLYIAAAFGASAAFINPLGYQTNLMVVGPGAYSIRDFIKVGLPLSVIYAVACIASLSIWFL